MSAANANVVRVGYSPPGCQAVSALHQWMDTCGGGSMKQIIGTAVLATAMTVAAAAQTKPAAKSSASPDQAFAREAAIGGMVEVDLGNLAKDKASSADVKQFGDRMVADHSKAGDELKQWAQQKNVTLPAQIDAKHKATHDRLAKESGAAFDKAYMR